MKKFLTSCFLLAGLTFAIEQTQGTSSSGITFSDKDFASAVVQSQEVVTAAPKIITQRFAAEPKIITERTVGQPKVITENWVEPLRQKIMITPSINQKVEHLAPDYRQEISQVVSSSSTLPVQTQYEQKQVTHTIDGDRIYNTKVFEPTVKRITEQLNVIPGGEITKTYDPIYRPVEVQNVVNKRQIPLASDKIINQPIIQPIYQKENV